MYIIYWTIRKDPGWSNNYVAEGLSVISLET